MLYIIIIIIIILGGSAQELLDFIHLRDSRSENVFFFFLLLLHLYLGQSISQDVEAKVTYCFCAVPKVIEVTMCIYMM